MTSLIQAILIVCAYVGLLVLVGRISESRRSTGTGWTNSPTIYALSLGVYCTTWTFYGSVGKVTIDGMLFLPVYLGPTLGMFFAPTILRRLIRLKEAHHITSLADFISARYAKSRLLAALVTVMLLFGTIPYAALQLKSVGNTFELIIGGASQAPGGVRLVMPFVAVTMVVFTVVFGIRRLDPTERHPGMVVALAAESLTKLLAFVVAGVFITGWAFGGFSGFLTRLSAGLPTHLGFMQKASGEQLVTWMTYMLLSTAAFSFLPRQFHVGVVENSNIEHTRRAMWLTPLYLLAINVFVVPVALAAMIALPKGASADTSLLGLPILAGQPLVSLLVFVGGFSAASGMVMVETMTMATMMSNHLFLPVIGASPKLRFLRRHLLPVRWLLAAVFILAALAFAIGIGKSYMLVSIGMLSFAAVLQLAPASIGGLFWRQGSRTGAMLGLAAGFILWNYTLLMPTFVKSGWMGEAILRDGPWGISVLRPTALFGLQGMPSLSHGVFWTMIFNIGLYIGGSVCFPATASEQRLAEEFVDVEVVAGRADGGEATMFAAQHVADAEKVVLQYFSVAGAKSLMERCVQAAGIAGKERITAVEWAELNNGVERSLAGVIGSASAHAAMHKGLVDEAASKALAIAYARMLARMRISPAELRKRVDYYQERETLLQQQASELEHRVVERTSELTKVNGALRGEITERKKAQAIVVGMSEQLAEAAHRAGKAEIATNVLHNVGNVLNSVITSVRLAVDRVGESRVANLAHIAELVETHEGNLAHFLVEDPKGKLLPNYLKKLATHLVAERDELLSELQSVDRNGEHIKQIISVQQQFAGASNFMQATQMSALIEDAIRITTLGVEGIDVVREFEPLPGIMVHKHKVLQILINLLSNARHALEDIEMQANRRICVRLVVPRDGVVSVAVVDNGMGVATADQERIFQHGFTTRTEGHGFGLHAAINAAREMGGTLTLWSEGPRRGATFTLEIPFEKAAAAAE